MHFILRPASCLLVFILVFTPCLISTTNAQAYQASEESHETLLAQTPQNMKLLPNANLSAQNKLYVKPITMEWTTMGGLHYFRNAVSLHGFSDFKKVYTEVGDTEAIKKIDAAKNARTIGWVLLGGGTIGYIAGVISMLPKTVDDSYYANGYYHYRTTTEMDTGTGLVIIGVSSVAIIVGVYTLAFSNTSKFGSVQHYNGWLWDQVESGRLNVKF